MKAKRLDKTYERTPKFRNNYADWREAFTAHIKPLGLSLNAIKSWKNEDIAPITEEQDQALYMHVYTALIDSSEEHYLTQDNSNNSGIQILQAFLKRQDMIYENSGPTPTENMESVANSFPPSLEQLPIFISQLRRDCQRFLSRSDAMKEIKRILLKKVKPGTAYFQPIMNLTKDSDIEDFCMTLADYVKMCHQNNQEPTNNQQMEHAYSTSDGNILPQKDTVNFMSAKEVKPSVEDLLLRLLNSSKFQNPQENQYMRQIGRSRNMCQKCRGYHNTRDCMRVNNNTECYKCGKKRHLQRAYQNPNNKYSPTDNGSSTFVYTKPLTKPVSAILDTGSTITVVMTLL